MIGGSTARAQQLRALPPAEAGQMPIAQHDIPGLGERGAQGLGAVDALRLSGDSPPCRSSRRAQLRVGLGVVDQQDAQRRRHGDSHLRAARTQAPIMSDSADGSMSISSAIRPVIRSPACELTILRLIFATMMCAMSHDAPRASDKRATPIPTRWPPPLDFDAPATGVGACASWRTACSRSSFDQSRPYASRRFGTHRIRWQQRSQAAHHRR